MPRAMRPTCRREAAWSSKAMLGPNALTPTIRRLSSAVASRLFPARSLRLATLLYVTKTPTAIKKPTAKPAMKTDTGLKGVEDVVSAYAHVGTLATPISTSPTNIAGLTLFFAGIYTPPTTFIPTIVCSDIHNITDTKFSTNISVLLHKYESLGMIAAEEARNKPGRRIG